MRSLATSLAPCLLLASLAACTTAPPAPTTVAQAKNATMAAGTAPGALPEPAPATPALQPATPLASPPPAPATGSDIGRIEPYLPPRELNLDVEVNEAIESTRSTVRSTAEWLARGVDSWFGDRPFEEGGKVTHGRASIGLTKREGDDARFSLRFNARFRLPNLERRAYLFVGRDNPRDVVTDKPGALSNQDRLLPETREERTFFAGLGGDLSDAVDLRLGFRRAKPYAQARYRYGMEISDRSLFEFRQTLFWTIQDSFGSTTALSWERAYSTTRAARWLTAATITRDTRKFTWSSILGGYQSFGDRRLLSLEALIGGEQGTGVGPSEYGVQARWTQPVIENRLIAEFLIGQFWPRPDVVTPRSRVLALGAHLKMEF
jgi:hypothetical protein